MAARPPRRGPAPARGIFGEESDAEEAKEDDVRESIEANEHLFDPKAFKDVQHFGAESGWYSAENKWDCDHLRLPEVVEGRTLAQMLKRDPPGPGREGKWSSSLGLPTVGRVLTYGEVLEGIRCAPRPRPSLPPRPPRSRLDAR